MEVGINECCHSAVNWNRARNGGIQGGRVTTEVRPVASNGGVHGSKCKQHTRITHASRRSARQPQKTFPIVFSRAMERQLEMSS
ncbi:hypothetical protein JTE90_021698 [Oedothorax gibbosus]|uniref:Uncharacterized protein n=1 Tax=Oedothorax gibbosus TaxID=931172 RepID=A0AAV6TQV6_9ARAC|nr:hypothetical protein JTE90_021698 [Oedothorax gibbosus]